MSADSVDLLDSEELARLIEAGEPDYSEIEEEVIETAGVTSKVWGEIDDERTVLGHVALLDYDDDISFPSRPETADLSREEKVRREADQLDGISAVFESSAGSYHVWNLSVDRLSSRVLDALAKHGDPMHVAVSWRRSMFVLRCSPKAFSASIDATGEPTRVYKDAPQLLDVLVSDSERPQSRGHFELLRSLAEQQGHDSAERLDAIRTEQPSRFAWAGDETDVEVSRYLTVTDSLKREVW